MALRNLSSPGGQSDQIEYYYDSHPTEEDLMGESVLQFQLIHYLVSLLQWFYRDGDTFVASNLNIYQTRDKKEYPLAPDVAVFKGVRVSEAEQNRMRSWKMAAEGRPAPAIVFEVCSEKTWKDDLQAKPAKYHRLGVKEYFVYDPNTPQYSSGPRLKGWRYAGPTQTEIEPDEQGWLWSEELESWLVPDGKLMRLFDKTGQPRLTRAEQAENEVKEARRREEILREKLRQAGIDPDK